MNTPITLQARVQDYLAERRRLGFQLQHPELPLMDFARYVDSLNWAGPLTLDVMNDWARLDKQGRHNPETWARRFKLLRPFIRYLRQFEPATAMPDESVFGPLPDWQMPHIYREQEIIDLLAAARQLGADGNLRAATYETLFGLLASTGLRVSETVHLLDTDVDLAQGTLTVRQTKFNKSRHLPLHPSVTAALLRYRTLRRQQVQEYADLPFFVGTRGQRLGKPLSSRQVDRVFTTLRQQLGWINRGAHDAPRVHDLRHTFAVRRVLLWQAQGTDIDQAMLALSTYMGHAIEQALAVPMKRFELPLPEFLSREEILAIIGDPGMTWISRRDHLLLGLLYNTGARVSEIIHVKVVDVVLDGAACVHLHGKGRKQRAVPLWKSTAKEIRAWLRLNPTLGNESALLPNREGQAMTRNNVTQRLSLSVIKASKTVTSLLGRHVSPHCIRHSTAMHLLQSGVDISVIALWLGHESPKTTYQYLEADLAMKDQALAKLQEPGMKPLRYSAPDYLLQLLKSL